jgi:hypothetical protein
MPQGNGTAITMTQKDTIFRFILNEHQHYRNLCCLRLRVLPSGTDAYTLLIRRSRKEPDQCFHPPSRKYQSGQPSKPWPTLSDEAANQSVSEAGSDNSNKRPKADDSMSDLGDIMMEQESHD